MHRRGHTHAREGFMHTCRRSPTRVKFYSTFYFRYCSQRFISKVSDTSARPFVRSFGGANLYAVRFCAQLTLSWINREITRYTRAASRVVSGAWIFPRQKSARDLPNIRRAPEGEPPRQRSDRSTTEKGKEEGDELSQSPYRNGESFLSSSLDKISRRVLRFLFSLTFCRVAKTNFGRVYLPRANNSILSSLWFSFSASKRRGRWGERGQRNVTFSVGSHQVCTRINKLKLRACKSFCRMALRSFCRTCVNSETFISR